MGLLECLQTLPIKDLLPSCEEEDCIMTVHYLGTVNNSDMTYCNEQARSRLFLVNIFREILHAHTRINYGDLHILSSQTLDLVYHQGY